MLYHRPERRESVWNVLLVFPTLLLITASGLVWARGSNIFKCILISLQQLFGRSVQPPTPSPSSLTPPTTPSSSAIASARAQQISAQKRLANRQAVAPYTRTSPAPMKSASSSPTYHRYISLFQQGYLQENNNY